MRKDGWVHDSAGTGPRAGGQGSVKSVGKPSDGGRSSKQGRSRVRRFSCRSSAVRTSYTLIMLFLVASTAVGGCGKGEEGAAKVKIAVDILPLAQVCSSLGGDLVYVEVLVPPGSSPHTYELTPGQVEFLSEADIVVVNGLGLAPWAEEIPLRVENPRLKVINAGERIPVGDLIPISNSLDFHEQHQESGAERSLNYDPHFWLDPVLMAPVAEALGNALIDVDPDHASAYRENLQAFLQGLDALHDEIRTRTGAFTHRDFIAFHSSWTYFARRYGLRQLGVIEERPGKEPSSQEIAELVKLAREQGVVAIFAERQFNPRVAEVVAEETGGEVRVFTLDPLGDPGDPARADYFSLMRYNLGIMEEALR